VQDDGGLSATKTTSILVKNFPATSGDLIAWYPFSGNSNDISGNNLHGQVFGAQFVNDISGNPASALLTDGFNDRVTVENNPLLNFQNAITVSARVKPTQLFDKEMFLLSHGSWQNRWKISITPEKKIRWTVKTLNAVGDLDTDSEVLQDSVYHLIATYGDGWMLLFVNGELSGFRPLTGNIHTTTLPLLMAQMLPDNTEYNFKGLTDEVKIFDYALTPEAARTLYENSSTATTPVLIAAEKLLVSPNPGRDEVWVILPGSTGELSVFDAGGRLIETVKEGVHTVLNLNTTHWQTGVYTLIFKNEKTLAIARFIKM
jgi:hypothetical protein